MTQFRMMDAVDIAPLDELLLEDAGLGRIPYGQRIRPIEATRLRAIPRIALTQWCQARARYNVPSAELIIWLKEFIGGRPAIEIGAGMGDLGRLLGIHMTDSAVQAENPAIRAYYELLRVPPINPPPDVERIEALEAVKKHRPRVVIGAWITQLYESGDEGPPPVGSSVTGVDELAIMPYVEAYVHIGNAVVHKDKRILQKPHEEHRFPFLFSRAFQPEGNVIWVWSQ